jgi:hypothetical protein
MHRSMEARLVIYPLSSLAALLLFQGTNAGIYYLVGMGVYFWAFCEGEVSSDQSRFVTYRTLVLTLSLKVVCPKVWALPKKVRTLGKV